MFFENYDVLYNGIPCRLFKAFDKYILQAIVIDKNKKSKYGFSKIETFGNALEISKKDYLFFFENTGQAIVIDDEVYKISFLDNVIVCKGYKKELRLSGVVESDCANSFDIEKINTFWGAIVSQVFELRELESKSLRY